MIDKYQIKEDIKAYLDTHKEPVAFLADKANVSASLINKIINDNYIPTDKVLDLLYSFFYKDNLRLNKAKSEIYQEEIKQGEILLFHGSKEGISALRADGSRKDCDFGSGFYCSLALSSAISFVCDRSNSSCYLFKFKVLGLKIEEFNCDINWMLSVCLNRGMLSSYKNSQILQRLAERMDQADVIIVPIADNKMFQVMRLFGEGKITSDQAMHALSASSLGNQYVLKTERAVKNLSFLEKLYLSNPERDDYIKEAFEREKLIQTKLDYAKRQYRNQGKYIDELLK